MRVILASSSPRRRQLLEEVGLQFDIQVADIDESQLVGESPEQLVHRLSYEKAAKIADLNPASLVIGADTDVDVDGGILGKPQDFEDACRLLTLIQGRTHKVWGGLSIICRDLKVQITKTSVTEVDMLPLTRSEIEGYVRTGEPMDKAGAYAMQGIGGQFVSAIRGSHTNVIGLDLPKVMTCLKSLNLDLTWKF